MSHNVCHTMYVTQCKSHRQFLFIGNISGRGNTIHFKWNYLRINLAFLPFFVRSFVYIFQLYLNLARPYIYWSLEFYEVNQYSWHVAISVFLGACLYDPTCPGLNEALNVLVNVSIEVSLSLWFGEIFNFWLLKILYRWNIK